MDMLERATRETANAPIAMGEALGQLLGYEYQRSFRGRISGVVWAASRVRISTVDKGASGGVRVCMEPFKRARARGPKGTFSPRRRAQTAPLHGVRKGWGRKGTFSPRSRVATTCSGNTRCSTSSACRHTHRHTDEHRSRQRDGGRGQGRGLGEAPLPRRRRCLGGVYTCVLVYTHTGRGSRRAEDRGGVRIKAG